MSRSLQLAKEMIHRSKEKAQDLIMNNLKVERETAAEDITDDTLAREVAKELGYKTK